MKFGYLLGIALWALIPGFIAKNKGRNFWGYFFLSFLISPLITIIIILCLSDKTSEYYYKHPPRPNPCPDHPEAPSNNGTAFVAYSTSDGVCFCRKCGERMIPDSRFCGKCGTEVMVIHEKQHDTRPVASEESTTVWLCGTCKAKNLGNRNDCWSCGSKKQPDLP